MALGGGAEMNGVKVGGGAKSCDGTATGSGDKTIGGGFDSCVGAGRGD